MTPTKSETTRGRQPALSSGLGVSLFVAGSLWGVLLIVGNTYRMFQELAFASSWPGRILIAVALAVLLMLAGEGRRSISRWLTSPTFAVSLLVVLLLATAVGTFILQGLPSEGFEERYGKSAGVFRVLMVEDLFHSLPFRGFLGLLGSSMVLLLWKRKAWRFSQWGLLLSHGGVVLVLIGGLLGSLWGSKSFLDLHEGQAAEEAAVLGRGGVATGETLPLGFGLRLDDFELENYPAQYLFLVYEHNGREFEQAASFQLEEAKAWSPLSETEEFRLLAVFPDFEWEEELHPSVEGAPAVQLKVPAESCCAAEGGNGPSPSSSKANQLLLLAGVPEREGALLPGSGLSIRFVWEVEKADPPLLTGAVAESHVIEVLAGSQPHGERFEVLPGETHSIADGEYELQVLNYYPDFKYDTQEKQAYTASSEPLNPVLQVSLRARGEETARESWLFAKLPDWDKEHERGALPVRLVYHYHPARAPAERELVIEGSARMVHEYRQGERVWSGPLELGTGEPLAPAVEVRCERFLEKATVTGRARSRSQQWRHPVVELELRNRDGTARQSFFLELSELVEFSSGQGALVFDRTEGGIKAYRSRVSILEGNRVVRRESIEVNKPLSHGGYRFYQSNYRKEDPTYSGLQVVRDPGLPFVYTGFVMISLGVIFLFYVRGRGRRAGRETRTEEYGVAAVPQEWRSATARREHAEAEGLKR